MIIQQSYAVSNTMMTMKDMLAMVMQQ